MFKSYKSVLYNLVFGAVWVSVTLSLSNCSLSYGDDSSKKNKEKEKDVFVGLCMDSDHANAISDLANGIVSPSRLDKIPKVISLLGNQINTPEKEQALRCLDFVPQCIPTYQMLATRASEANLRCPSEDNNGGNDGDGNGGGIGGNDGNNGGNDGDGNGGGIGGNDGNNGGNDGDGNGGGIGGNDGNNGGNDGDGNGGGIGGNDGNNGGNDGDGNGGGIGGNDGNNGGNDGDGNGGGIGGNDGEERERDESASIDNEALARLATPSLPLPNGDESVPANYEERKTILEEQYEQTLSLPGLDEIQADLISQGEIAEDPYPGTDVNTPAGYRLVLTRKVLSLGEDGKIPAMVPYEPPSDTSVSDAGSTSTWQADYFARFDSDNNPRYIIHTDNYVLIVDSIATGTRRWDEEEGRYVSDSFEPTEEHLSLRQTRTINHASE